MSRILESLIGDDEELNDDESQEECAVGDDQQQDIKESIILKALSEKKKHDSKKNKFVPPHSSSTPHIRKDQTEVKEVIAMNEEEIQQYHNLKLHGIQGPKQNLEEVNKEVNFKLDVLQSSKMFFEVVDPCLVTIMSGSKAYEKQYKNVMKNSYRIMQEKGYHSQEEMLKHELTNPRFLIEECSHTKSFKFVQQLLSRTDHLTCLSTDHKFLFICGGRNGKVIHNDFISYDIANGKMYVYRNLMLVSHLPSVNVDPALNGYAMFELNGSLYIIGRVSKNMDTYKIENVLKPMEVIYSSSFSDWWQYEPNMLPYRNYFSHSSTLSGDGADMYIFGGKDEKTVFDDLHILHVPSSNLIRNQIKCAKIEKPITGDWPSARYHHSSCMIENKIFVYGGMNAKNQLLNDLYMFDTTTMLWTEINVDSMLPPPVFKHQAFSVNQQSFYIYGGQHEEETSSSLFRFDIFDRKWSLIEIVSDENKLRLAGHQCLVSQGKVWIIGGHLSDNSEKNTKSFVRLLNTNDSGKPLPICNYLESKRKDGYLCDVVFKTSITNELQESTDSISYILAHKCIIKARCSFLYEKIQSSTEKISSQQFEGTFLEEELTIVDISQCNAQILEKYLDFIYTCAINLSNSIEVNQFLEFTMLVSENKHFPFIQKICLLNSRKDLSLTREILNGLHSDFSNIIDDKTSSDLFLVLDQENRFRQASPMLFREKLSLSPGDSKGIFVHKLIVSRSPFFSRMFVTSGMMETKEKVVSLTDYSKEVMLDLLKYLYTDNIQLTPRNCLGILIYSLMLDLNDLAGCCRRMVSSLLDNNNVWTIHEISILYNEKTLQSECEHYIANNYTSLSIKSAFLELPEMSRIKIKQIHDRKKKKK